MITDAQGNENKALVSCEHMLMDQYCANYNIFIIENLCSLQILFSEEKRSKTFITHTYPKNYDGITGLPCLVISEIKEDM